MSKNTVEIRCTHCKAWFPSPIKFGGTAVFDMTTLIGNTVNCANCGRFTGCNKENMRLRSDDGGFLGTETYD